MKIAFGSSALSEKCYSYSILTTNTKSIASATGLWNLGSERWWYGWHIMLLATKMHGHLSSFTRVIRISHTLINNFLNSHTPPHKCTLFSILCINYILIFKGCCSSNSNSSFTKTCHVEWYFTLSLAHI
jgi:hypothetical protein